MVTPSTSPLAHAAAIGDELRARSGAIETNRTLPPDVVTLVRDRGLFRFWVPTEYGGPEVGVQVGLDTFVELARHDAAVAWCSFIAATTSLLAARLAPDRAAEVYGSPDAITGGFAQPMGRGTVVDGGLRVSGRWAWGSGTQHGTHVGGGVVVEDGRVLFAFFDPADVTFHDTWHVLGLSGSGSGDYSVDGAFVPERRWVDLRSSELVVDRPLYRISFFGMLAAGIGCTAIGILRRAIEEVVALATEKVPQNSSKTLAERPATQTEIAKAEAVARSATAFVHDAFGSAEATLVAGDELTVDQRRFLRLATTDATQRSADAVVRLYRLGGGEAVYERNPLERLLRDVNVCTQHAMAADRTYELIGRLALGLETNTAQL